MNVVTDWSVYLDEPKTMTKQKIEKQETYPDRMSILGGRQTGKTTTAIKILVDSAKERIGAHAFITQTVDSRDNAMSKILEELNGVALSLTTKTKVTLENGSQILVSHNPNMIRGYSLSSAVIDCHTSEASEYAYMTLAPALAHSGKLVVATGDMRVHEDLVILKGFSPHIL